MNGLRSIVGLSLVLLVVECPRAAERRFEFKEPQWGTYRIRVPDDKNARPQWLHGRPLEEEIDIRFGAT